MRFLVTGGAGFIGSAVCRLLVSQLDHMVVTVDKLTYAGNRASLRPIENSPNHVFVEADICAGPDMLDLLNRYQINVVMHLAAESHVDRSIDGPAAFIETNVTGTFRLLEAARAYWNACPPERRAAFRFHHISTDEVFGDLPFDDSVFTEATPYAPSSPYSASKAASDHLVRAWGHTYGLPVVLSNCSNNYGPYHFPEKLIPLAILNALEGKPIGIYGTGGNVRDWLHVEDHARALHLVATRGTPLQTYLIGARAERTNLAVVEAICAELDRKRPRADGQSYARQIRFVADRPGHDRRYAIDPSRIERELGWRAQETFESGLSRTIDWYLANEHWWRPLRDKTYGGQRLGQGV